MKPRASGSARDLKKAFRDLHDSVRRVGLSAMAISEGNQSFELAEREDSAHERLQRYVEIEKLKPRIAAFQSALTRACPQRDVTLSLGWSSGARPDYVLSIAGRRVLDGGKAAIEAGLMTFLEASETEKEAPRARRVIIPRMHEDWLTLVNTGRPLMGRLSLRYVGFDLWNDLSEHEALALFEEKRSRSRNAEGIGPIMATAEAKGPGETLLGDSMKPGYLAAHAPLASRATSVIREIRGQIELRAHLDMGLKPHLALILGARGVQSVDIVLERRPAGPIVWRCSKDEIEGGTEVKQQVIRDAAWGLSTYLEEIIEYLGVMGLADARLEIKAQRVGRNPIETVSLSCQIAGAVCEFEMDWRGVLTGAYPKTPFSAALDVALANFAVAADLCKEGPPGLYVAVHANGSPWTAHAYWAASARHAAWLELNHSFSSGFLLRTPEITAYPLELLLREDLEGRIG